MAYIDLDVTMDSEHVAVITLNRPDARNAYSDAMVTSLVSALDDLEENERVRVVILTGAGRSFSAGGDLKAMRDKTGMFAGGPVALRSRYLRGIHTIPRRIARFDKPIVAAINGAAIGAGLDLTCMCDIRVAAEHAKLGSTFVKVGLIPGDGGAYFLARTIGFPRALEMVLTGRVITAAEAFQVGLVHEVCAGDVLMDRARDYANRLASVSPLAVQLAKRAAYRSVDLPMDGALELAATYQGIVQNTNDHLEGVNSTLEKREPCFKGE